MVSLLIGQMNGGSDTARTLRLIVGLAMIMLGVIIFSGWMAIKD